MSLLFDENISTKSNRVTGYIFKFTKINYQNDEKPDKTVPKNYMSKVLNARPFVTLSLPFLDNLGQFLGHTAIMNPFEHSNM